MNTRVRNQARQLVARVLGQVAQEGLANSAVTTAEELVDRVAREHIKPLGRKAKLISARRVDNWTFEVTFSYDGGKPETQLVRSYIELK